MTDNMWDDQRITAYVLDELTVDEREQFERELADDASLRDCLTEAQQIINQATSVLEQEDVGELSNERRELIGLRPHNVVDQTPESTKPSQAHHASLGWRAIVALAASVMLLIGAAAWWNRQSSPLQSNSLKQVAIASSNYHAGESTVHRNGDDGTIVASGVVDSFAMLESLETSAEAHAELVGYDNTNTSDPLSYSVVQRDKPATELLSQAAVTPNRGVKEATRPNDSGIHWGLQLVDEERTSVRKRERLSRLSLADGLVREQQTGQYLYFKSPDLSDLSEADRAGLGVGPGESGDRYDRIIDNAFMRSKENPLSTFSIDVDTASYSKVRMYLTSQSSLPRPDAVRIEELVNYFDYQYEGPEKEGEAFAARMEVASCPWNPANRLARVAIKGREIAAEKRPSSNLVFLLDVSGSMDKPNKLPLVKRGMQMLLDQLGENDRVAIVVYAGAAGLVLDSITADDRQVIYDALERLKAGGSTNGGDGIQLAYQVARDHFIPGGTNRVILCTDGDFNVGMTGTDSLVQMVEKQAGGGIFLTVLGFGMGNHNDSMLEQISGRGDGNYAFIDTDSEAHKVLVQQISGTLVTIAKNVKIQVEFNPANVAAYRLIGYENRILAKEDFNDDTKDAGEIGAGHTVTAFYELVPVGGDIPNSVSSVDELKYMKNSRLTKASESGELLTLKLRHMLPDAKTSTLKEYAITDDGKSFDEATLDFQFAASVAGFGMLLRDSPHKGDATFAGMEEIAEASKGEDPYGLRKELVAMIQKAATLASE